MIHQILQLPNYNPVEFHVQTWLIHCTVFFWQLSYEGCSVALPRSHESSRSGDGWWYGRSAACGRVSRTWTKALVGSRYWKSTSLTFLQGDALMSSWLLDDLIVPSLRLPQFPINAPNLYSVHVLASNPLDFSPWLCWFKRFSQSGLLQAMRICKFGKLVGEVRSYSMCYLLLMNPTARTLRPICGHLRWTFFPLGYRASK